MGDHDRRIPDDRIQRRILGRMHRLFLVCIGLLATVTLGITDPQPGEPCIRTKQGVLACMGNSFCSTKNREPICEEKCHNTATRKGRDIPRKFKYFCDYGGEKPVKTNGYLDDRLPLPGFTCDLDAMVRMPQGFEEKCLTSKHPNADQCYVPEGCDTNAWCNIGHMTCEERCLGTPTRKSVDIPRHKGWCDYGGEDPEDLMIARDDSSTANTGQIGDRCLNIETTPECAGNAWCHLHTMTCYEKCQDQHGTDGDTLPRMDRWGKYTGSGQFCDYSSVPAWDRFNVWVRLTFGISTTLLLPVVMFLIIVTLLVCMKLEFTQTFLRDVINRDYFDNSFGYARVDADLSPDHDQSMLLAADEEDPNASYQKKTVHY